MKTYNRALDYMTLAMVCARKGDMVKAAKMFTAATKAPDAVRAVGILEMSNRQAFEGAAAKKVAAKKAVKASEEFDMDDEAMAGLMDESDDEDDLGGDTMEASADDEDEAEEAEFAAVLASMNKTQKKRR